MTDVWAGLTDTPTAQANTPKNDVWGGLTAAAPAAPPPAAPTRTTSDAASPSEMDADVEGDIGVGNLLTSGNFWRGMGRGALNTYYGSQSDMPHVKAHVAPNGKWTIEHLPGPESGEAEAEERAQRLGLTEGEKTPEGNAGQLVGGLFGISPYSAAPMGLPGEAQEALNAGKLEEGHPLTEAARAQEAERTNAINAARAKGLDIPDRQVTPQQAHLNSFITDDLNLPQNSRATPELLDEARNWQARPAYDAVRATPERTYNGPDLSKFDPIEVTNPDGSTRFIQPPRPGDKINGADTEILSREFRGEAARQFDAVESNPNAYRQGKAYKGAANAIERDFRTYAENPEGPGKEVADNWDNARTYVAKTYQWQRTLDGDGNVIGSKISKLRMADEKMSDSMREASRLAGAAPEQFKNTRIGSPQPGPLRRGIAAVAPAAVAGAGGLIGGPGGAVIGDLAGKNIADRLLGR